MTKHITLYNNDILFQRHNNHMQCNGRIWNSRHAHMSLLIGRMRIDTNHMLPSQSKLILLPYEPKLKPSLYPRIQRIYRIPASAVSTTKDK